MAHVENEILTGAHESESDNLEKVWTVSALIFSFFQQLVTEKIANSCEKTCSNCAFYVSTLFSL